MTKSGLKKLIGVMFGLRCRQAWYTSNDSSAGGDERRRKGFSEHICRLPWAHEGHHRCRCCNRATTAASADDTHNQSESPAQPRRRPATDGAGDRPSQGAGYPGAMPVHQTEEAGTPGQPERIRIVLANATKSGETTLRPPGADEDGTVEIGGDRNGGRGDLSQILRDTLTGCTFEPGDEIRVEDATESTRHNTTNAASRPGCQATNPYRYRWLTFGPVRTKPETTDEEVEIRIGPDPVSATLKRLGDEDADCLLGRRWRLCWNNKRPMRPIEGSWARLEDAKRALRTALGENSEQAREQISFSPVIPRAGNDGRKPDAPWYSVRVFWYGVPCSGSIDYEATVNNPSTATWTVNIEPDEDTDLYKIDGALHEKLSEAKRHVTMTLQDYISAHRGTA